MPIVLAGVNHRTAPIEIREKLTFSGASRGQFLGDLRNRPTLSEAALLSTCNRTEAYVVDSADSVGIIRELYSAQLGDDVTPFLYVRHDREAASHLFRVVSGLDSMIVGEAQIQGQVRDAWATSRETTGAALNRLFQHAQLVGSRVREETGIGRGAASVSSAAVQLARKIFGSLSGRHAMVLGAGDVAAIFCARVGCAGQSTSGRSTCRLPNGPDYRVTRFEVLPKATRRLCGAMNTSAI
jgi:glutamyl-tRNA reductase